MRHTHLQGSFLSIWDPAVLLMHLQVLVVGGNTSLPCPALVDPHTDPCSGLAQ